MRYPSTFATRALVASCSLLVAACGDDSPTQGETIAPVALKNQSVTPALLKSLVPGVEIYSLVSSDDVLPGSPNYRFGGSADGAGFIKNTDGSFTALVNH